MNRISSLKSRFESDIFMPKIKAPIGSGPFNYRIIFYELLGRLAGWGAAIAGAGGRVIHAARMTHTLAAAGVGDHFYFGDIKGFA